MNTTQPPATASPLPVAPPSGPAATAAAESLEIVVLGLSVTSSWGNGHATTYRALLRELHRRGHRLLFLERDVPWYAQHRDLPAPPYCTVGLYESLPQLRAQYAADIRSADFVLVGSYVPDGAAVGEWVLKTAGGPVAFYDIDTPITLAALRGGDTEYLSRALVPRYDLYLSFTGGPTLSRLEREFGARAARALYCSVDPEVYAPQGAPQQWALGYLGTYSADRQPALQRLLIDAAAVWPGGRFAVAGPLYPADIAWPANVQRIEHLPPGEHRRFYNSQRFTLNLTRADMVLAGWSPSVRVFEAAACGVPILSDAWPGLESFFTPNLEILIPRDTADVLRIVREMPAAERRAIGDAARRRVLAEHTAARRAAELERYIIELTRAALGRGHGPCGAAGI